MVDADIGGEPADDAGKVIVRAAVKGGVVEFPFALARPIGVFELVLDEEQPHAGRRREQEGRNVDQQDRPDPEQQHQADDHRRDAHVGAHGRKPRAPAGAGQALRPAMLDQEHEGRADAEHHQWVTIEAVTKPLHRRQGEIFFHGEGVDAADAPAIQGPG